MHCAAAAALDSSCQCPVSYTDVPDVPEGERKMLELLLRRCCLRWTAPVSAPFRTQTYQTSRQHFQAPALRLP